MFKKSLVSAAILTTVVTAPSFANSCYYKSGFYAGGQVGVGFGNGKFNATQSINPAIVISTSSASGSARKTSALFGILGGYRHLVKPDFMVDFSLELDVFANNQVNKQLAFFPNPPPASLVNNSLKKTFTVMPSVSFGKIFCSHWKASVGLGLAISRFKQEYNILNPTINAGQRGSSTKSKLGVVPMLGIEYATSKNVSLFANVGYEFYGKLSKTNSLNIVGANPAAYAQSIKPNYWNLKVGAIYKF